MPDKPENTENEEHATQGSRRDFFKQSSLLSAVALRTGSVLKAADEHLDEKFADFLEQIPVNLTVNGNTHRVNLDPRTTLLDLLREELKLTGTKKGCDHGQCGACTVLLDGQRINACLHLAVLCQHAEVTTIEGLQKDGRLHPMQQAFLQHDAFQCGYCTPGQICSAIGLLQEGHAVSDAEIREAMSGNICRCGAYQNILGAIKEVKG
jgi:xanthine dehydrogenase YagT iron-sulfur-binding subunit